MAGLSAGSFLAPTLIMGAGEIWIGATGGEVLGITWGAGTFGATTTSATIGSVSTTATAYEASGGTTAVMNMPMYVYSTARNIVFLEKIVELGLPVHVMAGGATTAWELQWLISHGHTNFIFH